MTATADQPVNPELSLRWSDCDSIEDPISRIECRTSHLNDGFHTLVLQTIRQHDAVLLAIAELRGDVKAEIARLDGQDRLVERDQLSVKKKLGLFGLATAVLSTLLKAALDHLHIA